MAHDSAALDRALATFQLLLNDLAATLDFPPPASLVQYHHQAQDFFKPFLTAARDFAQQVVAAQQDTHDALADHATRLLGLEARLTSLEARVAALEGA